MIVLICATSVEKTMPLYLRQLEQAGFEVRWGAPASPIGHKGQGWTGKLVWQREALSQLSAEEKVIISDGWDVVFQGDRAEVEEKFPPPGRILITGEKACSPDRDVQILYPMGPTAWMFVNSGGIAGKAGDLRSEMERGFTYGPARLLEDDQRFWTWLFLSGKVIDIDYQCRLFQSTFMQIVGADLGVGWDGRMVNMCTKTKPNFLHWNGGSDWPVEGLKVLGMEVVAA